MDYRSIIHNIGILAKNRGYCDNNLAELLMKHSCYFLLSMSAFHKEQVRKITAFNAPVIAQRYKAFSPVAEKLSGIPYAHIKGALLSSHIYGNTTYRRSGDIDILTSSKYLDDVIEALKNSGFVQGKIINGEIVPYSRSEIIFQSSFSHQVAPFVKATESRLCPFINVDVNTNILWGESNLEINMNEFLTHIHNEKIHNAEIKVLRPVWEFIALCLHHYKDMNSIYLLAERGLRLSQFCDIYFYLINIAPNALDIAEVAHKYNVDKFVYYVIYFANYIFSDDRLKKYLVALHTKESEYILNTYGLSNSEIKNWSISFEERLLSSSFKEKFYNSLSKEEIKKIQLNRKFM